MKNTVCPRAIPWSNEGSPSTEEPYVKETVPSVNCILGDKLTAFAPHTTGIPFGVDKELEIIKQLYDVSVLVDAHDNYDDVY
ncbi:MAG: hypothetical protein WCS35_03650, partial [Sphaerochaeta sp.]